MVKEYTYSPHVDFYIDMIDREHSYDMGSFHTHHKYELYYEVEGARRYFIEDSAYIVNAGNVILIGENQIHKTGSVGDGPTSRIVCNFSREYLQEISGAFPEIDLFSFMSEENNHLLSNITVKQQNYIYAILQQLIQMQDENSSESAVTRKMLLATLLLQLKKMCENQHELGGRQRPGDQPHRQPDPRLYCGALRREADPDKHCQPVLHQPVLPQPSVQKDHQPEPDRIHQRRTHQSGAEHDRKDQRKHFQRGGKDRLYDKRAFPAGVQRCHRAFAPAVPPIFQAGKQTGKIRPKMLQHKTTTPGGCQQAAAFVLPLTDKQGRGERCKGISRKGTIMCRNTAESRKPKAFLFRLHPEY